MRSRTRDRRVLVGLAVLLVVAVAMVVAGAVRDSTSTTAADGPASPSAAAAASLSASPAELQRTRCAAVTARSVQRADATTPVFTASPGAPAMAVLGDSYAQGSALPDPKTQAWPAPAGRALGRTTWVDAVDGTGFVNPGYCGGQTYDTRLASVLSHRPSSVLVEGGLNDTRFPPPLVAAGADRVLAGLAGVPEVVVVGPTLPPGVADVRAVRVVDETLRGAAARARRPYVSALAWPLRYTEDGVHPTVEAAQTYATLLVQAIRQV